MKRKDYSDMCSELGLSGKGNDYFGVIGEWPVWICGERGVQIHLTVDGRPDGARKDMREAMKPWGMVACDGNKLLITLFPKKYAGAPAEAVREALRCATTAGFKPQPECPYCKNGGCDVAAVFGRMNEYRLTHRACLQNRADAEVDKATKNKLKGNYLLGIIGAILGTVVGMIPSVLTVIFNDTEYAALFALMPICAYFGYKFFGGRMNKAAIIVTVIMAILGVYMLEFSLYSYFDCLSEGYPFTAIPLLAIGYLIVPENLVLVTPDLWVEFIFAALGVYISWRIISRTAESRIDEAVATLDLAVPYPPAREPVSDDFSYYAEVGQDQGEQPDGT